MLVLSFDSVILLLSVDEAGSELDSIALEAVRAEREISSMKKHLKDGCRHPGAELVLKKRFCLIFLSLYYLSANAVENSHDDAD
ncbi:MAG: hypothetical protein P8J27_08780 [Mariniblastus sp.]|nr:hypothetical protein [Mariniblastus sp.]